jgi:hypothetical protein
MVIPMVRYMPHGARSTCVAAPWVVCLESQQSSCLILFSRIHGDVNLVKQRGCVNLWEPSPCPILPNLVDVTIKVGDLLIVIP